MTALALLIMSTDRFFMETNIIKYYDFLTCKEYEQYSCYKIVFGGFGSRSVSEERVFMTGRWRIEDSLNTYPKSLVHAKMELRARGLDPGDEDYGLTRVLEAGDVVLKDGKWNRDDIELAMISLAEWGCIEPWILTCKGFNIRPVEYAKVMRVAMEQNIGRIGQDVESPLYYCFEFTCGKTMREHGQVTIRLRDDFEELIRTLAGGD